MNNYARVVQPTVPGVEGLYVHPCLDCLKQKEVPEWTHGLELWGVYLTLPPTNEIQSGQGDGGDAAAATAAYSPVSSALMRGVFGDEMPSADLLQFVVEAPDLDCEGRNFDLVIETGYGTQTARLEKCAVGVDEYHAMRCLNNPNGECTLLEPDGFLPDEPAPALADQLPDEPKPELLPEPESPVRPLSEIGTDEADANVLLLLEYINEDACADDEEELEVPDSP
jgi:hypothetical protein